MGFYYMEKDQRLVAGFLVFIGVVALILGFVQTRQGINVGLAGSKSRVSESAFPAAEGEDVAALKAKDTDKDGLSDYEESRVTRTSPYIADSDSDGITDGEELKKGTDPNCPQGKTCAAQEPTSPASADLFSALKPPSTSPFAGSTGSSVQLGANASPAQLRAVLQQSGHIAPDLLAKISDEELLATWRATTTGDKSQIPNPNDQTITNYQLPITKNSLPSVAEMRAFLKSQGISEELLKNVSDDQLVKIFQQSTKPSP